MNRGTAIVTETGFLAHSGVADGSANLLHDLCNALSAALLGESRGFAPVVRTVANVRCWGIKSESVRIVQRL